MPSDSLMTKSWGVRHGENGQEVDLRPNKSKSHTPDPLLGCMPTPRPALVEFGLNLTEVLVSFPVDMIKYPVKSNLWEKGFYFGSQFKGKSIQVWKTTREAVGHTAQSGSREQ